MNHSIRLVGAAVAAFVGSISLSALAQTPVTAKSFCVGVGAAPLEALGDRPGHSLQVSTFSCRVEGGPMDGAVMTGHGIAEYDGNKSVSLAGSGVSRKAGATTAFQVTEGATSWTISDGKMSGFTSSGRGIVKLATGGAASLRGKTYTWVTRLNGPGQFIIETTYD